MKHRKQLEVLEEELRQLISQEPPAYWSKVLAAPWNLLHGVSVVPTGCVGSGSCSGIVSGSGTGSELRFQWSWMWFVNLGQFVLGLWMAFSGAVGSLEESPALRGALVFLTYAVLLPVALSTALRACIPIGHFVAVEDNDFLPFRNLFDLCRKGVDELHSVATSTIRPGNRSILSAVPVEEDAPPNNLPDGAILSLDPTELHRAAAAGALNAGDDSHSDGEDDAAVPAVHGSNGHGEPHGDMRQYMHPIDRDGSLV